MRVEVRKALAEALRQGLKEAERSGWLIQPYLVYKREGNGWSGSEEMRRYPILNMPYPLRMISWISRGA